MENTFAEKIRLLRTKMNMSQYDFSHLIGIKQPTLSTYERGTSSPSLDVLITIAEKCDVSLDWLCSLESKRHFLTLADVIKLLAEINNIDGLTTKVSTIKDNNSLCTKITVNGNNFHTSELNHHLTCNDYLCKFLYDWEKTIEQLSKLEDDEIKNNYYQMWWDKQISYYSSIPLKTKQEANEEFTEQLYDSLLTHKLNLGD